MNKFRELGISEEVVSVLESLHFKEPTEIQERSIPLILEGKDVAGNAATGSGKTFAFGCGIIEKCTPRGGIQAVVLTPTRELAEQISKVMKVFSKNMNLRVQEIYGGVDFGRQVTKARDSEILIATPGRMLDHLQRGSFDLKKVKFLVLDEADRMVDMGFLTDVEKIISQCPEERQTLLFSATFSSDIEHIKKKHMKNPVEVVVKQYVDSSKLKQVYYNSPGHMKFSLLAHFLKQERSGIVLVFCNTRKNVDMVVSNLKRYKIHAHAIHGGMEQNKRSRVIESLHKNEADILVCTDVAARGLDIKNVSHVYNYDIPKSPEEYVHRIGRTARAGKDGKAVSIVTNRDYESFGKIMQNDSLNIEEAQAPEVEILKPNFSDRGYDDRRGGSGRGSFGGRRQGGDRRGNSGRRDSRGSRGGSGGGSRGRNDRQQNGGRRDSSGRSQRGRKPSQGKSFGKKRRY